MNITLAWSSYMTNFTINNVLIVFSLLKYL